MYVMWQYILKRVIGHGRKYGNRYQSAVYSGGVSASRLPGWVSPSFWFDTAWGHKLSLDNVIDIANHGRPVIVSWPPARYAGGHLLVVTGGNSKYVYLADSSSYNYHSLSRSKFLSWWEGFSAIVTPK